MKVRTEARREAIIKEATLLFCELGFERASMSGLAKRLGGSKATLYGYFESKEALFMAVIESLGQAHLDPALQELASSDGRELCEVLQRFGEVMTELINNPNASAVYRMVIGEAGRSEVGQLFYESGPLRVIKQMSQLIQRAIENGTLRPCDPDIAAKHFIALIKAEEEDHLFKNNPSLPSKKNMRQTVARAIEVFMGGYKATE